jgi:hypothetical protein
MFLIQLENCYRPGEIWGVKVAVFLYVALCSLVDIYHLSYLQGATF